MCLSRCYSHDRPVRLHTHKHSLHPLGMAPIEDDVYCESLLPLVCLVPNHFSTQCQTCSHMGSFTLLIERHERFISPSKVLRPMSSRSALAQSCIEALEAGGSCKGDGRVFTQASTIECPKGEQENGVLTAIGYSNRTLLSWCETESGGSCRREGGLDWNTLICAQHSSVRTNNNAYLWGGGRG